MQKSDIPEEVLRFIKHRVDSVPHMEALLLLWESPDREWTDAEVAARVYISREHALRVLGDLSRTGLIRSATAFSFSYDTTWDESQLMSSVAKAYREHLVRLSGLIHAKATSDAVRDFARAFQFKVED
jgi:hypothetical protein